MVFNIQYCSIHDGDGLRTLVFFKGCPLRCPWCANPESQSYRREIIESRSRCIGCGACRAVCPDNAIGEDFVINRTLCSDCLRCTEVCFTEAKRVAGKDYEFGDLLKLIEKDRDYYAETGGVTFSGGEPLTHPNDMGAIAKLCHENGINVVVESCGYGDFKRFKKDLPYIDKMFLDMKIIDPEQHKKVCGASNERILENIKKISDYGIPITIRTPVVPGYTDSDENILGIAKKILEFDSVTGYELLKYHNFGESKYASLGREYLLKGTEPPTDERMNELVRLANSVLKGSGKECFWTNNNNRIYVS
jgi:pyruvate formate lyase activating enzyme